MKTILYNKRFYLTIFSLFFFVCFYGSNVAYALDIATTTYTPIVGIPGIDGDSLSTEGYVEALYYLAITVAAILAIYQILFGAIRWMFDGIATHKEEAKSQIQGAVFGLLIVLSAVLVLETINVDLTNLNIFGNAPALHVEGGGGEDSTPITIGSSVPASDTAAVARLEEECDDLGGEVSGYTLDTTENPTYDELGVLVEAETTYTNMLGCYIPISSIAPGHTYNPAIYPPGTTQVAFAATCEENGGLMNMNACIPKLIDEDADIAIGDTLDLGEAYDVNAHDAVLVYQENCPGKVVANVPSHTISCVALDDNPADDVRELECQMMNMVYNPVLESCF